MTVTIDGPAGTGKSSVAQRVARTTGLHYVNSGSLYRGITYALYADFGEELEGALKSKPGEIVEKVATLELALMGDTVYIGTEAIDAGLLRSDITDAFVAQVSGIPEIREKVNALIVDISKREDIIVEGRDMSTVVFPDAEVKFYLDASVEARAGRRHAQGTSEMSLSEIKKSITRRDKIDREKKIGALKVHEQAVYLDTSDLTIEQVCEIVVESIREHK